MGASTLSQNVSNKPTYSAQQPKEQRSYWENPSKMLKYSDTSTNEDNSFQNHIR